MGGDLGLADLSMPGPGGWQRAFGSSGTSLLCWDLLWQLSSHLMLFLVIGIPQVLSDEHAREMCLRFADMECKLGEIDRARAIYSFCSQICDPRVGMSPGRWVSVGRQQLSWPGPTQAPPLHRQLGPSGKHGRTSRYGMATRTPSGRCCVSAEVCRPLTTHRSTSWPHRCSRCRAALQALVSSRGHPSHGWVLPGPHTPLPQPSPQP